VTSALFAILQLDRGEPLGYGNIFGLIQAWLQDAGGFGAVGLILYRIYAFTIRKNPSDSERLRVPVSRWMEWMTAATLLAYSVFFATLILQAAGRTSLFNIPLAPPPIPLPPPGVPIILPPPVFHWELRPFALMIAGLFALLTICEPFARDILKFRSQRIWALSKLSFKEALRSRLLWVFLIVLLPFLFPVKWFLPIKPADELRSTISVLSIILKLLVLVPAVLLAAFYGIPNDIKNQTIHTVVTKPVERFEIVLGRFVGYTFLMTLVLAGLTVFSLVLISSTKLDQKAKEETEKARVPVRGRLEFRSRKADFDGTNVGREFMYRKYIIGHPESPQRGIWHFESIPASLAAEPAGEVPVEFTLDVYKMTKGEENKGVLVTLRFVTHNCPQAVPTKEQGGEWPWANSQDSQDYAEAVRLLQRGDILPADVGTGPDRDRLATRLRSLADKLRAAGVRVTEEGAALRTDAVTNLQGPRPGSTEWKVASALAEEFGFFEVRGKEVFDYAVLGVDAPSGLFRNARSGSPGKNAVTGRPEPRLSIYVKCESPGQMLGMADPDLYILEGNLPFALNYVKGMVGLWCQLCIVIGLAVACSTYLSGVLSLLLTALIYVVGLATDHLNDMATGRSIGGGPVEAMSRLLKSEQPTAPLPETAGTKFIQGIDEVWAGFIVRRIQNMVPDVDSFNMADFVAEGFNINTEFLVVNVLVTIGYLLPWAVLAYYLMKSREVAA